MSEPKNELEDLLELAAVEPAHRPSFFRVLLESTVWVPGSMEDDRKVDSHSTVELQHWEKEDGTSVIPFFSSLQTLQLAIKHEHAFITLSVRSLFEMTLGETLFLNAGLPVGKEFTPQEINHLMTADRDPLSQKEVLEGGETLLLSEVTVPPVQMVNSLTLLFNTLKMVKRAFLCYVRERSEEQPNLLIGLELDGDAEAIIHQVGSVATDTLPENELIDICLVEEGEPGISHFMMAHITPFYEKRWGSFLRDFKTNRII